MQRGGHFVYLPAQFFIREGARRAMFDLRLDGETIIDLGAGVFIEHVVDDVHFTIHAPLRPRFALAKIDNVRVRFVKLDTELTEHRVPEPGDVRCRSSH